MLISDHLTVQWRLDNCSVDTIEFLAAIEKSTKGNEIENLTKAVELYQDDLLPGLYDDWLEPMRAEYRGRICETLRRLAELHEELKDYRSAIPFAERLLALDSVGEANHQLLIRLHAANRDRASALRAYHQCMRVLRREMGVPPGPATVELFERLLKAEAESVETAKTSPRTQKARALVGRVSEWRRLAAEWQAAAEGGPRVVVISGEPGIGKSRLANELYQWCAGQGHATARARCYAGQGQVAYAPVAEWLRSDLIRAAWGTLTPRQLAELARLIPEIETSSTLPGRPFPERIHFYEALNSVIGKCRKPLLLLLDDLQWCDPDSFEWFNSLLNSPTAGGLLLVGTVRDEETGREHAFTRFLAGLRQAGMATEVALAPLDARETAELARLESTSELDSGNVGEIFRATRGNPLFVLESVRAGLQSTRVSAVIGARLSQLPAAAYELAGLASVVGRPFSFELLEKATDWDERSVSQALEELWRRRIVESRGMAEYDFTHDRLREVACSELSLVRRRYLHRRVARAIAEVYSADIENWEGQIASHFEEAGMAKEAIEHYWRAANQARKRFADTEAADLLKRALALCRGFPESGNRLKQELDLLVTLGPTLVTTEGYSAAEVGETYERALELSRRLSDRNLFLILSGAWVFHVVRGDLERARQFSLEFLKAAERENAPGLASAGNFILGSSLFHLGRLEESLKHMTAAASVTSGGPGDSVLELFAGPDIGVFCRSYLAHLAWHCGSEVEADIHMAEAIRTARRLRHPFSEAIALDYSAMLNVFRGDRAGALERGREAVELCNRHGFAYYLAVANILAGWAAEDHGQLRAGIEGMRKMGAEIRLPYYFALLAETYGRAGLMGEALASISTGLAFGGKNGEDWAVSELHRVQGNLMAGEGKMDAARASYRRGWEAAMRSGSPGFADRLSSLLWEGTPETAAAERL